MIDTIESIIPKLMESLHRSERASAAMILRAEVSKLEDEILMLINYISRLDNIIKETVLRESETKLTNSDIELTLDYLKKISSWEYDDLSGMMEYIKPLWENGFWEEENGEYHISTGGWSDNEEIIFYMMQNHVWWMLHWYQTQRGGYYIFCHRDHIPPLHVGCKTGLVSKTLEEKERE